MKRLMLAAVAVVALLTTTAGGCGHKPPAKKTDTFVRDCTVKGGHVTTERRGHSVVRVCVPNGGGTWQ